MGREAWTNNAERGTIHRSPPPQRQQTYLRKRKKPYQGSAELAKTRAVRAAQQSESLHWRRANNRQNDGLLSRLFFRPWLHRLLTRVRRIGLTVEYDALLLETIFHVAPERHIVRVGTVAGFNVKTNRTRRSLKRNRRALREKVVPSLKSPSG